MIRQKLQEEIKEENKKKKKLIELTLQERYSQSQQETERLRKVQAELVTLDKLVTQDVSMLRERIEEASRTLNNARQVALFSIVSIIWRLFLLFGAKFSS